MDLRRRCRAGLLVAGLAIVVVACSDDDSPPPTTTTTTTTPPATTNPGPVGSASAAQCDARDELRDSISALTNVDVVRNGTSAITDALGRIRDALGAVRDTAGADVQPQVDAFQQALDALQTAARRVGRVADHRRRDGRAGRRLDRVHAADEHREPVLPVTRR